MLHELVIAAFFWNVLISVYVFRVDGIVPLQKTTSNKVLLKGSFDMGWQKRGTGKSYNSLSGHGSLIGYHSKKILAFGSKSKSCRLCLKGHPPSDHDCRKNHVGSAKSMEPQLAVDLITRNPQLSEANVSLGTLIGDDDSCSIQSVRRESEVHVEKWSDLNHTRKGFSTALFNMKVSEKVRVYLTRSFSFAIMQNKGNEEGVRAAILNIENHSYGEHGGCAEWCKFNESPGTYTHRGLPYGKPLSSLEFRPQLAALLKRFADNAAKIAPCASSQGNENFNNMVATKNPKYKFNASSEALPFRVAATVGQKNIGKTYIMKVNKKLGLSPGEITRKIRTRSDMIRKRRSVEQLSKEFKSKRMLWKKNRNSKAAAEESREGISYSTGCEMNGIADLVDDPIVMNRPEAPKDAQILFFDLETTGLNTLTCEIIQIAASAADKEFSAYIVPQKRIPPSVVSLTGLKSQGGQMFSHGEVVPTVPVRLALSSFIAFLKELGTTCVLVAHNGFKFDFTIILRVMRQYDLLDDFLSVCGGFIDTLHVFEEKLPRLKSYKQTTLAAKYKIPIDGAHNALADVKVLKELVRVVGVSQFDLMRHITSAAGIVSGVEQIANKKMIEQSLSVLKPTVKDGMITKIAKARITLEKLKSTFEIGGEAALAFLLSQDVNGKPAVTKQKKKLEEIAGAVQAAIMNDASHQRL
ncbi:uncharacterized protein LOC117648066 [Thrips palmi]|uniref:Uncharacterized protein LOC117648066 n=1 Tax=Thrips palmi TaxID=161013 RepID=A0A6P8ZQM7_THRPL|nr:uncharacterized protein LOC117648066 [Thrips palmi]